MRRFGRRFFLRPRPCHCRSGDCIGLDELAPGRDAVITCNNNVRTIERGLYHGRRVSAFRNEPGEPNLVIAVGDSRYVMDRRVAKLVRVRVV